MHADQSSISYEKVGLVCARSVISAACGRRNSLREGFFGKLQNAPLRPMAGAGSLVLFTFLSPGAESQRYKEMER